jgi:Protein of unknown function (DUF3309)
MHHPRTEDTVMNLGAILVIVLILLLLGALPGLGPWSAGWGYYPAGGVGLLLLIVLLLVALGKI